LITGAEGGRTTGPCRRPASRPGRRSPARDRSVPSLCALGGSMPRAMSLSRADINTSWSADSRLTRRPPRARAERPTTLIDLQGNRKGAAAQQVVTSRRSLIPIDDRTGPDHPPNRSLRHDDLWFIIGTAIFGLRETPGGLACRPGIGWPSVDALRTAAPPSARRRCLQARGR
jgi:hypothetical protein